MERTLARVEREHGRGREQHEQPEGARRERDVRRAEVEVVEADASPIRSVNETTIAIWNTTVGTCTAGIHVSTSVAAGAVIATTITVKTVVPKVHRSPSAAPPATP